MLDLPDQWTRLSLSSGIVAFVPNDYAHEQPRFAPFSVAVRRTASADGDPPLAALEKLMKSRVQPAEPEIEEKPDGSFCAEWTDGILDIFSLFWRPNGEVEVLVAVDRRTIDVDPRAFMRSLNIRAPVPL